MKEQLTVHVVGNYYDYKKMFVSHGWVPVDNVEDADLIQFCGGEDVWPGFYNEQVHKRTYFNLERDKYEKKLFELAVINRKAIAGICRGAQFMHVMNGGKLYQDVDMHAINGVHKTYVLYTDNDLIDTYPDGLYVSSTHHQQMVDNAGEVILFSNLSTIKFNGEGEIKEGHAYGWDVEAVWHRKTRSFCYQPHPEFFDATHECQQFYFKALKRFLFQDKKEMKETA